MSFITENYEAIDLSMNNNYTYPCISTDTSTVFHSGRWSTCSAPLQVVTYSIDANYGIPPYRTILVDSQSVKKDFPRGILELDTLSPIFSTASGTFLAERKYIGMNISFAVLDANNLFGYSNPLVVSLGNYPDCPRDWVGINAIIFSVVSMTIAFIVAWYAIAHLNSYGPGGKIVAPKKAIEEVVRVVEDQEDTVQLLLKIQDQQWIEEIV